MNFIPKAKYTTPNTTETRRQLLNGIQLQWCGKRMFAMWDGGEVAFKSDAVYDAYTVQCLPIFTFAAGDLAYLMLLYGREDHTSDKCCVCRLMMENMRELMEVLGMLEAHFPLYLLLYGTLGIFG